MSVFASTSGTVKIHYGAIIGDGTRFNLQTTLRLDDCNLSSFKFAARRTEPNFRNRAGCETFEQPWRFNALHGQKELCRVCGVEGSSMNQIKFKFNQSDHSESVESLVWMSQVSQDLPPSLTTKS